MDTRGRNTWHTTEPWHNSPLPEGVSHAVTVPPGRGGGRSGGPSGQTRTGPQDGDLQSGTDNGGHCEAGSSGGHGGSGSSKGHGRCKELRRPWWCRELRRPWQVVFHGRGLVPRPGHSSRNPSTPQIISLGKLGGIRSPPGLDKQDSTWQDRTALRGQTDRTRHPTGTGSPPGLFSEAEASFGHGMTLGALTGSLSNRFHDKGASLRGQDRQDLIKNIPVGTPRHKHGSPGRDVWTGSTGLGLAATGGHESAAGIEPAAGRQAWGRRTLGTREPAGGLGIATAGGGQNTGTKQIKLEKTNKTKRGEGAPLTVRSGLLSQCTQQGWTRTCSRGRKLK